MLSAIVLIKARPNRIAALGLELANVEGVTEVYSVTGEEDFVVIVRVGKHADLEAVIGRDINGIEGVEDTRTLIAFRSYSRDDLEML